MVGFEGTYNEVKEDYYASHSDSFTSGDSPVTLDVATGLGYNGNEGYIVNDGAGDFTVSITSDGTNYGDEILMKFADRLDLRAISINKIRLTWVSNASYRVFVRG